MPVKFHGNTINKFGTTLPTLYLERVNIFDSYISVRVAMYVNANEGEDDTFTLNTGYLEKLNYYLMFVAEGEVNSAWSEAKTRLKNYYPPDEIGVGGTHRLDQLIGGTKTVFDLVRYGPSQYIGDSSSGAMYGPADVFMYDGDMSPGESNRDFTDEQVRGSDGTSSSTGKVVFYPKFGGKSQNFKMFRFADFDLDSTEVLYNTDGSPIYKFIATIDMVADTFELTELSEWKFTMINFIAQLHRLRDVSMVTFTSPLEIGDMDVGYDNILMGSRKNKGRAKLYEAQVSDATYEKMTHYGEIVSDPILIYVMPNGEEYDETPIQAINGLYYGDTEIALSDIVALFKEFVGTGISNNSIVQNMYDNINYILEEHGSSIDLLVQLNFFRKTFPEKSTTTEGGRMYEKVKIMIYNANNAVESGTVLMKKLIKSPVVKDRRTITPAPYRGLVDGWEVGTAAMTYNYINPSMVLVSKFSTRPESSAEMDTMDIYTSGYWFFDYERAIRKGSNLSRLLPIDRIESWFGQEIINDSFRLKQTNRRRRRRIQNHMEYTVNAAGDLQQVGISETDGEINDRYGTTRPASWPDSNDHGDLTNPTPLVSLSKARYDVNSTNPYPDLEYSDVWTNSDYKGDSGYGGGTWKSMNTGEINPPAIDTDTGEGGGYDESLLGIDSDKTEYTYDCLRNFKFANGLTIDDKPYRLMAMEFQDLCHNQKTNIDYEPTFNDFFTFSVAVRDRTMNIYDAFVGAYSSMATGSLQEYVEAAAEYCSYNSPEGYFNTFFINAMLQKYEGLPETAPWVLAPTIYHFHADLLTDAHGGSRDRIIDAAIRDSELINPTTGRLEGLQEFWQKFKDFYTAHYEPSSGDIAVASEGLENYTAVFGKFNSGDDGGSGNRIAKYPLPELQTDYLFGAAYIELVKSDHISAPETCIPGRVWKPGRWVSAASQYIVDRPWGFDPGHVYVSQEYVDAHGIDTDGTWGFCMSETTGLPPGWTSLDDGSAEAAAAATAETRGEIRMVKMGFGFKQIPDCGAKSGGSDGWIRITVVGESGELPDGSDPSNPTTSMITDKLSRDVSRSDGLKLYNSRWDFERGECKPNSERYRTVYLYAGIEYSITWHARADCTGAGPYGATDATKVFVTKRIKVPAGVEHIEDELEGTLGSTSGQAIGSSMPTKYTRYILRCDCGSTTSVSYSGDSNHGLYAKSPTSQWEDSIFENDPQWNKSSETWNGDLP
jgi:hypothetical protein